MPEFSRRRFIRDASIGAAAAGTVALAPGAIAAAHASSVPAATAAHPSSTGPVLAHLVNASTGEIAVLVGTRELRVFDKSFAQKLQAAAK